MNGAPAELLDQFRDALGPAIGPLVWDTKTLRGRLTRCRSNGWTMPALARECAAGLDKKPPGQAAKFIVSRVFDRMDQRPSPGALSVGAPAKFVQPKPWCGRCDGGQQMLNQPRMIEDDDGRPLGRCPDCYTDPNGA